MRTNLIFIAVFFSFLDIGTTLHAQIIAQDATGNSSILLSGASIGVDITEAMIKGNYYSPTDRKVGYFWGVDLQGKNSTGLAGLFSEDQFVPQSTATAVFGHHWSKGVYDINLEEREKIVHEIDSLEEVESEIILIIEEVKYISEASDTILKLGGASISLEINKILKTYNYDTYPKRISDLIYRIPRDERKESVINEMLKLGERVTNDNVFKEYILVVKRLELLRGQLSNLENNPRNYSRKNKVYIRGGINTTEFKFDLENGTPMFSDRFIDTLEVFGVIEIGYTGRSKNNLFGVSFAHQRISSFQNLKKSEYVFTVTDPNVTNGQLRTNTEVIAYSGNYFRSSLSTLRIDYLHVYSYNSKSSLFLAIGGYFSRSFFGPGNDIEKLEDRATLGLTISIIDGKSGQFNGGVYLQTSDLLNETTLGRRGAISFGLTTKYMFHSVISPQQIEDGG